MAKPLLPDELWEWEFTENAKEAVQPIPSLLRPALAECAAGLADGDLL